MAKKVDTLPDQIYVVREDDGDDSYLATHETLEHIDHGTVVGIYELVETRTLRVTRELK
jgi:hypothetical protein